jgi:four helix bundle protein
VSGYHYWGKETDLSGISTAPFFPLALYFGQNVQMFLHLTHTNLDIFKVARQFTLTCYQLTNGLPKEEKFAIVSQIRRAALSVHFNIAEGCSRKSATERKRFYEIARGSLIEVDTAWDIVVNLNYIKKEKLDELGKLILRCFQMLCKMIE